MIEYLARHAQQAAFSDYGASGRAPSWQSTEGGTRPAGGTAQMLKELVPLIARSRICMKT